MAHRPVWEGHLRLSLVTCPVALHKAVGEPPDAVHFHLLNPETHNRVKQKWCDPGIGKLVDRRALVRGFEVAKGEYGLVTDDELKGIKLESTKTIDIERFVDAAEIDRLYWDQPFYMVPAGKTAAEPFAVIREAMASQRRVALGKVVMASRERQVAVEVRKSGLLVSTLRSTTRCGPTPGCSTRCPTRGSPRRWSRSPSRSSRSRPGRSTRRTSATATRTPCANWWSPRLGKAAPKRKAEAPDEGNVISLMDALRRSLKGAAEPDGVDGP
jgi:DNA end-binding protein Ku